MRRTLLFGMVTILVAGLCAIGFLIALPCVTHRLYVVNQSDAQAVVHVSLGDVPVWSDSLAVRQRASIPIKSKIHESSWDVQVTIEGQPQRTYSLENVYYVLGHPHETDIYILVLNSQGIELFPMEHPFVSSVDLKCWKQNARLALVLANLLSCVGDNDVGWLGLR